MTDAIHSLRRKCCRTERLWKATGLDVPHLDLKDLQYSFNILVKEARTAYSANFVFQKEILRIYLTLSTTFFHCHSPHYYDLLLMIVISSLHSLLR